MDTARYDGHAAWYDEWSQRDGAGFMALARAALAELTPPGSGTALDIGCGTGLQAPVVGKRGYDVVGVDLSADQLRRARDRLPVARADARRLPVADRSVAVAYSVLTHTDLDDFGRLVSEATRVLVPGGAFVYVGVHPCFVGPFVEPLDDGIRVHPGYVEAGWQARTAFTGGAVRHRVGVHHLPLASLLCALIRPGARGDRVIERGDGPVPNLLAVRLRRTG